MIATTEVLPTLAWSLLHFLWQGTAIAAVAAALMVALRRPATRYLIGTAALVAMLVSFAVTFAALSEPAATVAEVAATGAPAAAPAPSTGASAYSLKLLMEERAAITSANDFAWIARGWLFGVFLFALRIALGLALLEQLRRRNAIALPDALVARFRVLQHRLGIHRAIQYCECHALSVPAVIGLFRPMVLLPLRALTGLTPEQLDAVIAHELAHIKRFDVAVNFFQVIAETLFFFHPAVWWLNKRIRADREDCCDDVAIAECGGTVGYARALATMETWRDVPDFAMAATGSPVAARVARLLGISQKQNDARTAGVVTASLVLATALIVAGVSFGIANPARAQTPGGSFQHVVKAEERVEDVDATANAEAAQEVEEVEAVEAVEQETATQVVQPSAEPKASQPPRAPVAPKEPAPAVPPAPAARPAPTAVPSPPNPPSPAAPAARANNPSFINDMNSVGLENLSADELIALKIQGVTSAYVREIRSTGLNPDVNSLVAMKVQDITPEYVKSMRELGIDADANDFIAMKVQGITPDYVQQMRAAGFNPSTHELIAMKVQDVTPEYRKALESAGFEVNVSDLINAKVMDITPEFIKQVRTHGFKDLNIDKLIQLKNADVF
jgi:beta-lactamase regulating signal transducer with metallopeptidase domain